MNVLVYVQQLDLELQNGIHNVVTNDWNRDLASGSIYYNHCKRNTWTGAAHNKDIRFFNKTFNQTTIIINIV